MSGTVVHTCALALRRSSQEEKSSSKERALVSLGYVRPCDRNKTRLLLMTS